MILAFLAFRPDKLFIDDVVDESLSEAFVAESPTTTIPPTTTTESTDTGTETTETTTTTTTPDVPETGEPAVVASGPFIGTGYSAAGTATIYEQDGSFVLRFEDDTEIQNGPDLFVWLLAAPDFNGDNPDGDNPTEYIDLGKLKGNIGGQNYQLPPEYDPEIHQSVLIWCLRFTTPFAAATLQ